MTHSAGNQLNVLLVPWVASGLVVVPLKWTDCLSLSISCLNLSFLILSPCSNCCDWSGVSALAKLLSLGLWKIDDGAVLEVVLAALVTGS